MPLKRVAIFASGNGSNAQRIIEYFERNSNIKIQTIITNKKDAYVIERAKLLNVPCRYFSNQEFEFGKKILDYLLEQQIDFIVLAGFLKLIPSCILAYYGDKSIVNIHPALLPKYGGKGMYGINVHQAVINNHESKSGITIHYVSAKYDEGEIIFKQSCLIEANETADTLANKIHALEYKYYPEVIEKVICSDI